MPQSLAERLKQPGLVVAPGVFDGITARIADSMGFDALYMTGYGSVASAMGLPDAGLATYADMVGRVRMISSVTSAPLIADGDTGYGGLLNVDHTVRGYEAAGASCIQIEDQEFPKKCGHTPGRKVIPIADAARKIKVAAEARSSKDFLILARTDARTTLGLDEALRRGEAFVKAGADIVFIESPESVEEMRRIASAFHQPLLANMVEGGRTPLLSRSELEEIGFKIAIFPSCGFLSVGAAVKKVYAHLRERGSTSDFEGELHDFNAFNTLMGFERVWEFDKANAED